MSSYISEYRQERRQDRWMAAQIEESRLTAAAERRRQAQADSDQQQVHRRAERRAARAGWFARLPDRGMAALWATMIVLPISLAWQAQALFALETLRIAEPFNHAFPAAIETGAWLCAFEAHRRLRTGLSAGLLPTYMWVLAGAAAAINGAHGLADEGPVAALALAVLSVLGVFLHSIRQGLDAARATGTGHARLALWRRLRYPRLSVAAASLRAARELDPVTAWELAWIDRFGVGPEAGRRERQLARRVVRQGVKAGRKAVKDGDVTIVAGRVQHGFAQRVRAHVDRERAVAVDHANQVVQGAHDALMAAGLLFGPDQFGPHETGANPPGDQHGDVDNGMSPRAAELLPVLVQAINDGNLDAAPGAKAVARFVKTELREPIGMPTAMELRDRLSGLRAITSPAELPASATEPPDLQEVSA